MTYGPVLKWQFPLRDKLSLESRKPNARACFIVLCVIAAVFVTFSYLATFHFHGEVETRRYNSPGDVRIFNVNKTVGKFNVDTLGAKFIEVAVESKHRDLSEHSLERSDRDLEQLENDTEHPEQNIENRTTKPSVALQDGQKSIWNDPKLNILHLPKPEFDQRFQNPCWYESLTSPNPYKNNKYIDYSHSAKQYLAKLIPKWEEIYYREVEPMRLRCLPHFMVIGQPKCGSTDLFWKLANHPDIGTPPIKELHWWSRFRQGRCFSYSKIIPLEDYVDMFDRAALKIDERMENISLAIEDSEEDFVPDNQVITGEASVSLFWDNNEWMKFPENRNQREPLYINPHYIHHIIPDVKLVLVLREPTERMYSDYLYFNAANKSADHFHSAVQHAIDTYKNCTSRHGDRECVYNISVANKVRVRLRVGMYSVYMEDWLGIFPKEQFFILRLEDYSTEPLHYIKRIYKFLDIRDITAEEERTLYKSKISNVRKAEDRELGGMHEETRLLLDEFYRPYNEKLALMLQNNKFLWNDIRQGIF